MTITVLIIDVQAAFCSGRQAVFDIDHVVDRINLVSAEARAAGVSLVQHEEDKGSLRFDTDGWQIYERLTVAAGDLRLRRTAYDSFYQAELTALLGSRCGRTHRLRLQRRFLHRTPRFFPSRL